MIKFLQHVPNFVEQRPGHHYEDGEFNTQEELLAFPAIARWAQPFDGKPFHRWSMALETNRTLLMAEYDEGRHWWVVGFITDGREELTLPQWEPKR
jgi:hypothetical protein